MARTLGEILKQRLAEKPDNTGGGMQDMGAQTQKLLQAKTGKQVATGAGPAASSLGEQQAVTQTGQQLGQVQARGQLIGTQQQQTAEAQQQSFDIQSRQQEQKKRAFKQQADQQISGLVADFQRQKEEGRYREAAADVEQAGFLARLSTDQYVNELQKQGQINRLEDMASFREQFNESLYEGMEELLQKDLSFKSMINADQREFEKGLANMNLDAALNIIKLNAKTASQQAQWNAFAQMLGAGVKAAGSQ